MASFIDRLQHAWNAFSNPDRLYNYNYGEIISSNRPDRVRLTRGNERSIVTSVYNRLALDIASITIKHVKVDENNNYVKTEDSTLNECLNVEANLDQTGRAFIQDVALSLFDEGCIAIVPVETNLDPLNTGSFHVTQLRTGKILEWMPNSVKVRVYNEKKGDKEDIILPKRFVAIIENPFYSVMNEQNSTSQRLIRKLNLLDVIDEQSGAGKLDIIIQLPYAIKTSAARAQAEIRRKDIEMQLAGSKYGIAYTDGTEKITQLNRSVENNLMSQIEYLTNMLFGQLGITIEILNGTADEKTMANYYARVIEPVVAAITDEMKRKFLTKTARSQRQSIIFYRDPFKLVPVSEIADISDKMTRNEIMSSNEVRQKIGLLPVDDEKANELRNKNINAGDGQEFASTSEKLKETQK